MSTSLTVCLKPLLGCEQQVRAAKPLIQERREPLRGALQEEEHNSLHSGCAGRSTKALGKKKHPRPGANYTFLQLSSIFSFIYVLFC
ncbi:uncharacterized [Tachysurus ichikawai]